GIGQFDPPADAAKERLAQVVLQRSDLVADRRLGDIQFLGGTRKAPQPRGGLEADERGKRGEGSIRVLHEKFLPIRSELPVLIPVLLMTCCLATFPDWTSDA